jgi:hypothetical protein
VHLRSFRPAEHTTANRSQSNCGCFFQLCLAIARPTTLVLLLWVHLFHFHSSTDIRIQ